MNNNRFSNTQLIWIILAASIILLLFGRMLMFFRFAIFILLALLAISFGGYALWSYVKQRRAAQAFRKTEAGIASERIAYCEEQIGKNQRELREINENIKDLEQQIKKLDTSARNLRESRRLIEAFRSEASLRRQKISFYELCIGKLRRLVHNHQLTERIAEKREQLELLQENHYEELASLEELKTELEMSADYLDTIETLSLRMLESTDYDDATRLKLELEEMTRDLDAL